MPVEFSGTEVAIIGMAGRFPKSKNLAEFWRNLRSGVECISFLTIRGMGQLLSGQSSRRSSRTRAQ